MEGIQTIQALKAVQSSLPAQTTIPSDELVMLYAADGTPIAKIARDDLVKAVASVMASNSQTTFSKLLGVQANGTPMGIGASDLASVLGDKISGGLNEDADNILRFGCYGTGAGSQYHCPSNWGTLYCFKGGDIYSHTQFFIGESGSLWYRVRFATSATWSDWVKLINI